MPDLKPSIVVTSVNQETLSRHDLLDWVNATVNGKYQKIEELCSGTAYCQMMELLHPNCIGLKKVKTSPKLEHEWLHNLKLLQGAFTKMQFDKSVPIDRLVKGRFQDNFEFLQWFKKYFDTFSVGKENLKVPAALVAAAANAPKPIRKPAAGLNGTENIATPSPPLQQKQTKKPKRDTPCSKGTPETISNDNGLQKELQNLILEAEDMQRERDAYKSRILKIKKFLEDSIQKNEHVELIRRFLEIFATDDNVNNAHCNMPVEALDE